MNDIREFVIFKLNGEHYGLNIHNVENIEKQVDITRVPHTKKYIKGVINLRGNVIPIVDLRERFGLETKPADDDTRIIIMNHAELKIGVIVDSSSETLQLSEDNIDAAPSVKASAEDDFIREIGKHNNRIIMLLDIKKVLGLIDEE
jgi:purine-binding chemotaxis protein CheW